MVYKVVNKTIVILRDADTRSAQLPFSQPVATDRLIAYGFAELEAPLDSADPARVELMKSPAGVWKPCLLKHQSATGLVLIEHDDGAVGEEWLDLATVENRWVAPGLALAGAAPAGPSVEDG